MDAAHDAVRSRDMTAAIDRQSRRLALAALVIGPALLIAGTAIGYNPSVIFMLPMGTAWVQGAIALPLVVLGPAVLSLAWWYGGAVRAARVVAAAISVLFVVVIAGYVAMTATQIGCQPVTNPIQTLPQGVAWGAIAAVGFWGAVRSGAVFAHSAGA